MTQERRYFAGRELKPYVEPVEPGQLVEGSIYFSLNFIDTEMLLPILEPVVFLGLDLLDGDSGRVYFQDAESFQRGVQFTTAGADDDATFSSGSVNEIAHIFEFDKALDILLSCQLNRAESRERDRDEEGL
jgi:hypothetical protein